MAYNFSEQEKEILKFWSDNKIFGLIFGGNEVV